MALTPVAVLMFRFNNPDALLDPADGRRRRRHPARASRRPGLPTRRRPPGPLARPRRRAGRPRLPDQDAAGVPGAARPGAGLPALRADLVGQARSATCSSRSARCCSPAAGGSRSSSCGPPRAAPTSAARRTTRSSSSPSATTASAGSAATRPARSAAVAAAAAAGAPPACSACSTARSAARSPGCSRPPSSSAPPPCGSPAGASSWSRAGARPVGAPGCWSPRLTFSFMAGIFHAYYTVALAPAVAALVGIGAWVLWRHRSSLRRDRACSSFTVALTSVLGVVPPGPQHRLPPLAEVGRRGRRPGRRRLALAAAGAPAPPPRPRRGRRSPWSPSLAGPAAYAVSTAATPHTGSIPTAGPTVGRRPGRSGRRCRWRPGRPGGTPPGATGTTQNGTGTQTGTGTGTGTTGTTRHRRRHGRPAQRQHPQRRADHAAADRRRRLHLDRGRVGANNASGYQLASEQPVMAIGGFNGSDPSPTLAQFQQYVADGQIHWFIASGGMGGGPGGSSDSSEIATVGRGQLHRHHRRRRHPLRPLRRDPVSALVRAGRGGEVAPPRARRPCSTW